MKTLILAFLTIFFISGCGVSYKYSIPEDDRIIVKMKKYYLVPGLEKTLEYNVSLEYMDSVFPMELLTNKKDKCRHLNCNANGIDITNLFIYKYIGIYNKQRIEFVLYINKNL